ncbi:hypothetical protein ACN9M1_17085 [Ralstonia sp. R-29]|uniref:hypothetical protein n=1 Tax=Ralstonia sp. R-29 TaxID=3404059 RepID=UPI003CEE492C
MPTDSKDYWFPAKRYGWGWGLPARWQGWVVLAIYAVLLAAGIVGLRPGQASSIGFVVYVVGVSALLVLVCWWKGEPPRWRWGKG